MSRILTAIACLAMSGTVTVSAIAMPEKTHDKSAPQLIAEGRFKPKIPEHLFSKGHPRTSAARVLVHAAGHLARQGQRSVDAYQVALKTAFGKLTAREVHSLAKQVEAVHDTAEGNKRDRSRFTNATAGLLRHYLGAKGSGSVDPLDLYNVPSQASERERTLEQAVKVISGALPQTKK